MYNTDLISTYCPALINYSMKVYPLCVTLYFLLLLKSSDLYSHLMYVILVKVFCDFFNVLLLKRRAPILFSYNYQSLSIINKHLFTELRAFMVLVMLYFFWYCLSSVFSTSALLVACFYRDLEGDKSCFSWPSLWICLYVRKPDRWQKMWWRWYWTRSSAGPPWTRLALCLQPSCVHRLGLHQV